MTTEKTIPSRFLGLDVHKYYLVATGVDDDLNKVYGPKRVELKDLDSWISKALTPQDSVVIEMSTNTWQLHDDLKPHVHSVTVVHPPYVALITRAQVMTDKIAAFQLARLHAKGLLYGIWVPPQEVRDLRTLVAQRQKMISLKTQAKNRLHAVLHRYHFSLPEGKPFAPAQFSWWLDLPVSMLERVRIQSNLDTLIFSEKQIANVEACMAAWAAQNDSIPFLIHLTGIGLITATTVMAAIGDITRFPSAKQLVGYAGLGARVHDSGLTKRTGGITKAGRKDLRGALVEAAQVAVLHDPHWKRVLARMAPRTGRNKAVVAVARKMLVIIWYVLSKRTVSRYAIPDNVARKFYEFAYRLGKQNRPEGQKASAYVRHNLDKLGIGSWLTHVRIGKRKVALPPSILPQKT